MSEKETTKADLMERILVSKVFAGLCTMRVCAVSDATNEEILAFCNEKSPSGTSRGWTVVRRESDESEAARPIRCEVYPGRTHVLVEC